MAEPVWPEPGAPASAAKPPLGQVCRLPVLPWEHIPERPGEYADYWLAVLLRVGIGSIEMDVTHDHPAGFRWSFMRTVGSTGYTSPREAMLAAEDWLRAKLAHLAPLFRMVPPLPETAEEARARRAAMGDPR